MAWTGISNTVPQYEENGIAASGFYIKFYASGTVTPIPMAIDSTGVTTLAKCVLSTEGYPLNGSSAVFIPHIDQTYKIILYRNAVDADADTTGNAVWIVDSLDPVLAITSIFIDNYQSIRDFTGAEVILYAQGKAVASDGGEAFFQKNVGASPGTYVDNDTTVIVPTGGDGSEGWLGIPVEDRTFDTKALMVADVSLAIGQIVRTEGYTTTGDFGGNTYEVVAAATGTDDGGTFIDLATHQAKALFPGNIVYVNQYGARGIGSGNDGATIQAALDAHKKVIFTGADYRLTASLLVDSGHWCVGNGIASGNFIQMNGAVPIFKARTATTVSTSHCRWEALSLYNLGSKPAGSVGIDLTDISNAQVINCRARFHETGIVFAGSLAGYYNEVISCEIASNTNGFKYGLAGNSNRVIGGRVHGNFVGFNIDNINDFHIDSTIENNETGIQVGSNVISGSFKGRFEGNGDFLGTSNRNPAAGAVVISAAAADITDLGSHYSGESDKVVDFSRKLVTLSRGNSGAIDGSVQAPNVMANPTLTTITGGVANGWVVLPSIPANTTYSGDVVTKETGTRSQKIEVTGASSLSNLETSFNVQVGVPFTVSMRITTNEDDGWRMLVGRTSAGTEYRQALIRDAGGFVTYTATFIPTTTVVYVTIKMQSGTESITGATINIDSITGNPGSIPGLPGVTQETIVPFVSTAGRPPNPQIGINKFDSTIGKPIWYDGTNWVDATGATV